MRVDYKELCNSKDIDVNDGHKGYVSIRNFLRQLDENESLDLLLTGQNIDTLCNYGVTRSYHLLDMIQLMIFKIYGPLLKMGSRFHIFLLSYLFYLFLSRVAIKRNSKDLGRFSLWITRRIYLPATKNFSKRIS